MLTTRVLATSGQATVAGIDVVADPVRARAGLAVVPQRPNLDRELTARLCRLSDLTRVVTLRGHAQQRRRLGLPASASALAPTNTTQPQAGRRSG